MIEITEFPYKRLPKRHGSWVDKKRCSFCGKLDYAEYVKRYKFDGISTILCEGCRKRRVIRRLIKMQGQYIHISEYRDLEDEVVRLTEDNNNWVKDYKLLKMLYDKLVEQHSLLEDYIESKMR
jgi:hypothetical protein